MTISAAYNPPSYTGDGATVNFPTVFPFFGATTTAELKVIERTISTGVEVTLTNGTEYTVTGGSGATGTVVATVAPPSTIQWKILRETTRTQEVDYIENDPFPAATHEGALDRLTAIAQEDEFDLNNKVGLTEGFTATFNTDLPTDVNTADTLLGIDSAGTAFEMKTLASLGAVVISNDTPQDLGTAAPGTGTEISRSDHVHGTTGLAVLGAANAFTGNNTYAGTSTHNDILDAADQVAFSGDISPAQITANQNDFNPTDLADVSAMRLTSDASRNITGLQGGADGRLMMVFNVGSFDIVLTDEDSNSTAANRFVFASGDLTLSAGQSVSLRYDATSSRWRDQSDKAAAGATAATQAEQEAATSNTVFVTPANQQFHPSAIIASGTIDGTGTVALSGAYNVQNLTDLGTGSYRIEFINDAAGTDYRVTTAPVTSRFIGVVNKATGQFEFSTLNTAASAADADFDFIVTGVLA